MRMVKKAFSAAIISRVVAISFCMCALVQSGSAQAVSTFAGNAQHTGIYTPPAQDLNQIRWSTSVDLNNIGSAHYGAPLITSSNTVVVPVKTINGFQLCVFDGSTGAAKYSLLTDYILPDHSWIPVYQPVLTTGPQGSRLYYPGAGGTIFFI